ncbi:MAG: GTP cyclohydrolase I [Candidatus Promineifilaceae bacterium]|jgi:GTP cyclohydrolase I
MKDLYRQLIESTGDDITREGLVKTPARAAEAFEYLTQGYKKSIEDVVNDAIFESENDEMVIVKGIEFFSLCEHHLLPFFGQCHVGYIPDGKILGLSKIARIVDVFARRLQVQETLTYRIACALRDIVGAQGVGVVVEAKHMCMMMRGVEKQSSIMKTSAMLGAFRSSDSTRNEFLSLIA